MNDTGPREKMSSFPNRSSASRQQNHHNHPRQMHNKSSHAAGNRNNNRSNHSSSKRFQGSAPDDQVPQHYLDHIRSFRNTQDDVVRWREERKARFPRSHSNTKLPVDVAETSNLPKKSLLNSHFADYASSSDGEEEDVQEKHVAENQTVIKLENTAPVHSELVSTKSVEKNEEEEDVRGLSGGKQGQCHHFMRTGRCRFGERCQYSHDESAAKHNEKRKGGGNHTSTGPKLKTSKELLESLLVDVS